MINIKAIYFIFCMIFSLMSMGQQTNFKNEVIITNSDSVVFTVVPFMPQFGKTKEDLQNFIVNETKFKTSKTQTINTKNLFVQIIIEKDGSVTFGKIVRGLNKKYNREAKRIVKNMPNWEAGKLKTGSPVRVSLMFPIWFE